MKKHFALVAVLFSITLHILPARAEGEVEGARSMPASGAAIVAPGNTAVPPPLPDLPLGQEVMGPVTPRFVIEHRSALDGQSITVHGVVVSALTGDAACPPGRGMCAQPRVTLTGGEAGAAPDPAFDLLVLLPEGDATVYAAGQETELQGRVSASGVTAVLRKE